MSSTRYFKFTELNRAKWNPRVELKPSDREYQDIHNSIKEFGFLGGGVVNIRGGKNTLVGGHQRVTVMTGMATDYSAGSTAQRILRMRSDAELRQADFYVGKEKVTRRACEMEQERRAGAREYARYQRERGEY